MSEIIAQNINELDLSFKQGDDFSFDIEFPFSLTTATIKAKIGTIDFTKNLNTEYICSFILNESQTESIENGAEWYIRITKDDYTRTYFRGRYIAL